MNKRKIMESMSEEHIFKGCENPELIDEFIKGIKHSTKKNILNNIESQTHALQEYNFVHNCWTGEEAYYRKNDILKLIEDLKDG